MFLNDCSVFVFCLPSNIYTLNLTYITLSWTLFSLFFFFSFIRTASMAFVNIRASSNLHGGALRSVLNAPTSFFDVTPIGRIISRFSKDLHTMDTELGKCEI